VSLCRAARDGSSRRGARFAVCSRVSSALADVVVFELDLPSALSRGAGRGVVGSARARARWHRLCCRAGCRRRFHLGVSRQRTPRGVTLPSLPRRDHMRPRSTSRGEASWVDKMSGSRTSRGSVWRLGVRRSRTSSAVAGARERPCCPDDRADHGRAMNVHSLGSTSTCREARERDAHRLGVASPCSPLQLNDRHEAIDTTRRVSIRGAETCAVRSAVT